MAANVDSSIGADVTGRRNRFGVALPSLACFYKSPNHVVVADGAGKTVIKALGQASRQHQVVGNRRMGDCGILRR